MLRYWYVGTTIHTDTHTSSCLTLSRYCFCLIFFDFYVSRSLLLPAVACSSHIRVKTKMGYADTVHQVSPSLFSKMRSSSNLFQESRLAAWPTICAVCGNSSANDQRPKRNHPPKFELSEYIISTLSQL
jgi:hypothetical protein